MVRSAPVTAPAIAGSERAGSGGDDDRAELDAGDRAERLRRELEADAAQWIARRGRSDAGLLDRGQLSELATWLTPGVEHDLGLSDAAKSFIAASQAAARRAWWPGRGSGGSVLAILLILGFLATPIILLLLVVLAASVIHRFG